MFDNVQVVPSLLTLVTFTQITLGQLFSDKLFFKYFVSVHLQVTLHGS
jgi:hypothetical protein